MIVVFSGWCQIDDKDVRFQSIEEEKFINGEEYLALSDEERECYILEDIVAVIRDSYDGEWDSIDVLDKEEE